MGFVMDPLASMLETSHIFEQRGRMFRTKPIACLALKFCTEQI
jgi:hypothetical protein